MQFIISDIVMSNEKDNYLDFNQELSYSDWLDRQIWLKNVVDNMGYTPRKTGEVLINKTLKECVCAKKEMIPVLHNYLVDNNAWLLGDDIKVVPRYDRRLYDYSLPGAIYEMLRKKGLESRV